MTARQARNQRRAAERTQKKAIVKGLLSPEASNSPRDVIQAEVDRLGEPHVPIIDAVAQAARAARAEINHVNALRSTGPKTLAGKAHSSRNAFKHGLYSTDLVLPGEDPAELDHLRFVLREEHQPANTIEEILVNEVAEHFWRLRRMRRIEAITFQPENLDRDCENGFLALVQRIMISAERSFHKTLSALQRAQQARGFVPQSLSPEEILLDSAHFAHSEEIAEDVSCIHSEEVETHGAPSELPQNGFVSSETLRHSASPQQERGFVSQIDWIDPVGTGLSSEKYDAREDSILAEIPIFSDFDDDPAQAA